MAPFGRVAALIAAILVAGCGGGGGMSPMPAPVPAAPPAFAARIDALAQTQIGAGLVPSLAIGVARGGRTVFARAYGARALPPAASAADPATGYEIASLTKAFTATALLLLAQDGKLALDDPLSAYVPEYPPAAGITLRQMLNMVSGIPGNVDDAFTTLYGPIDHESVVTRLAQFPLDFAPGTRFEYANANYYLLGLVVERVAGTAYPAFIASRILAPLGLTRTGYLATWNDPDTALGYYHNGVANGPFQAHPPWSADYLFAMGGLVSDVPDLLRWEESLRSPGLLNATSLATMFRVPDPAISRYAMGWFIDPDGTRWHNGESGGFTCAHGIFPDGYDVVVLGNTWDQYAGAFDPIGVLQAVHGALGP